MTDFLLLEKISEMNSKNPRPQLLYQKGVGLKGTFSPYMCLSDYTKAQFLQDPNVETPVIVRFSRAMGETGSSDSRRDTRGFAAAFFTEQGRYDLICHNFPVYYIRHARQFPDMVNELAQGCKDTGEECSFWKFLSENPEAINLTMELYSNEGTLKSYRFMEGYSVNTYKWINDKGNELYVRYRWNPLGGGAEDAKERKGVSYQEAEFLAGFSPDCCISDLAVAAEEGNCPEYELEAQIMNPQQAKLCGFDFLSVTLAWSKELYPYMKIGKMTLKTLLAKEECREFCFAPSNLVPGIEFGNTDFLEIMDYAHKDGGRQRGAGK